MVARSGSGWALAPCLALLIDQLDARYPDRGRASDGSIGDARHQAESFSDHNPRRGDDGTWWVTAVDITTAAWSDELAELLTRDSRVKYVIWRGRYFQRVRWSADPVGQWVQYNGTDPHTSHIHLSVLLDSARDEKTWALPDDEDEMSAADVAQLRADIAFARDAILHMMRGEVSDGHGKWRADPGHQKFSITAVNAKLDEILEKLDARG